MAEVPIPRNLSSKIGQRPVRTQARQPFLPPPPSSKGAQAEFFGNLSQVGMKWFNQAQEREAEDQLNSAQVSTMEAFSSYQQDLRDNPGVADTDLSRFNQIMGQTNQQINSGLTNKDAAREFGLWIGPQKIQMSDWAAKNAFRSSTKIKLAREEERVDEAIVNLLVGEGFKETLEIMTDPKTLKELGVTADFMAAKVKSVNTLVKTQRAETKLQIDEADKASVETINGWINKGEIGNIEARIKALPGLTETRKTEEVKKAKNYIEAVLNYKDNVVTTDETRIKVLGVISDVKSGLITRDEGIEAYTQIANAKVSDIVTMEPRKLRPINTTDGKTFINQIYAAGEAAKDAVQKRNNSTLKGREKQLRDAIEKQPSFFPAEEAEEILKDFANKAVIELNDKFSEGDFTKDELDAEVNTLINKFALTEGQQLLAVSARQLDLAENLEQQQKSITEAVTSLRKEGRTEEAKAIMDEAISLGIFEQDGETIKKKKGKEKVKRGLLGKLIKQMTGGNP